MFYPMAFKFPWRLLLQPKLPSQLKHEQGAGLYDAGSAVYFAYTYKGSGLPCYSACWAASVTSGSLQGHFRFETCGIHVGDGGKIIE
jgi:hypothetical protein